MYFNNILKSSESIAIIATDRDFTIKYINPMAEKIYRCQTKNVTGSSFKQLLPSTGKYLSDIESLAKLVEQKGEVEYEYEQQIEEENYFLVTKVTSIADTKDIETGFVFITTNTTDTVLFNKRQQQLLKELSAANGELKDFAHIVSHDLKAPLRAISMLTSWLKSDYATAFDAGYKEEKEFWLFTIQDNGSGISEHDIEKIFQIFQVGANTDAESSGVGLTIVKKIVEMYGGSIWVESKIEQGSKFSFTYPKDITLYKADSYNKEDH